MIQVLMFGGVIHDYQLESCSAKVFNALAMNSYMENLLALLYEDSISV